MHYELQADTEPGARLVALAEELAADFATRADQHDRDGTYPYENIEALKQVRYFAAPFPRECGGLGVESAHDLLVASSRLARGDASLTLGVNMHLAVTFGLARAWLTARAAGDAGRATALAAAIERMVAGDVVIASTVSEPNQDLTRPKTRAERTEAGWVINGIKVFGTMAPAADMLSVGLTYVAEDGSERGGFAMVPAGTPGVTVHDDWDALGMRASGSGSVTFKEVHIPEAALRDGFAAGVWSRQLIDRYLISGPMHAAASLGVAEAAQQQVIAALAARVTAPCELRPSMQILAAESAIDLMAMRAAFSRAGRLIDDYFDGHACAPASIDEAHAINAEVQCAKAFVHQAAIRVVDRALTMSGGSGYLNTNRLSRLYRDVRAGPFMHPLGINAAHEYIGQVTLGLEPSVVN